MNPKEHWENIYISKPPHEVSWTQQFPTSSLRFLESLCLPLSAKIIDVGGGDSQLADQIIERGFENVSVLDISASALERTKARLRKNSDNVKWIESNILEFETDEKYDFWHDRAVFHFLTKPEDTQKYKALAVDKVKANGWFLIGTFSESGPMKCSGLEIKQYSEQQLIDAFSPDFQMVKSFQEEHKTPFDTIQHFQFCLFQRIEK